MSSKQSGQIKRCCGLLSQRSGGPGNGRKWKANVVCHATGLFNRGKIPAIPGATKFQGQAWHTADWPAHSDLSGKRVAVIGTGPSAA